MCLPYPCRQVQERFLIELLELDNLNQHSSCKFLMRKRYLFIWKTIFDKVLKLAKGVTKPLQRKKTLKVLTES